MDSIPCANVVICMVVYNDASVVDRSLPSLLAAGFDRFTILDVESHDTTVAQIRALAGDAATILTYPLASLLEYGWAHARNVSASLSGRQWTLFVEPDEELVSGCVAGRIQLPARAVSHSLYSVQRRSLRSRGGSEGAVDVGPARPCVRLYQPSRDQRWDGYVREDISRRESSQWDAGAPSDLAFHDHRLLRTDSGSVLRMELDAFMLLQAFHNPELRAGTDGWWFDDHVPAHMESIKSKAVAFARRSASRLSPTDEGSMSQMSHQTSGGGSVLRAVSGDENDDEADFDVRLLRRLHSVSGKPWTGRSERVFWGEWDHPGEGSRSLRSIIDGTVAFNWNRHIKPGGVCIDIGGHSGDTAVAMGLFSFDRVTGRRGRVVVVEPNPIVLPVLEMNLAMNSHIAEYFMVDAAITKDDVDEIELADHGNAGCNGGVLAAGLSATVESQLQAVATVRYKTRGVSMATLLSHIFNTMSAAPVGFIKLDCEGYDKEILRPCRDLFARDKPVLFVEWFNWFTPEDDADLFAVIHSLGYVAFDPVSLAPARVSERVSDLLCVHESVVETV